MNESALKCANWDSKTPELIYDGDKRIGRLLPSAKPEALGYGVEECSKPKKDSQSTVVFLPQKYMTITTEKSGEKTQVRIRISSRHPDESCECERPDYDGDDIHDDFRMVFDIEQLRVIDDAAIITPELEMDRLLFEKHALNVIL